MRSGPARVLVVDDEPDLREFMADCLLAYDVTACADGESARDLDQQQPFDVILCDLAMPGFSGVDLYHAVQQGDWGSVDRIVFVTGGAQSGPTQTFLDSVDNHKLTKPFRIQALREVVAAVLDATKPGG